MKKISHILFILIFCSKEVFGLFGVGDIVSDPASYGYYAEQITAMNDQLANGLEQLEKMNKLNELAEKTNDLVNNSGEKIFNPIKKIQNLQQNLESSSSRFQRLADDVSNFGADRFFKYYHNVKNNPLDDDEITKYNEDFYKLFDNDADEKLIKLNGQVQKSIEEEDYDQFQKAANDRDTYLKVKKIEKQNMKKLATFSIMKLHNDYFLSKKSVDERKAKNQRIQTYIKEIKTHRGEITKQAMLTNLILVEMIDIHQEQYNMQLKFFNAVSLAMINKGKTTKKEEIKEIRQNYKKSEDFTKKIKKRKNTKLEELMKRDIENGKKSRLRQRKKGQPTEEVWHNPLNNL